MHQPGWERRAWSELLLHGGRILWPVPHAEKWPIPVHRDDAPSAPAGSCPNPKWTATVTDVAFTTATISLFEDSNLSDQETVPVS
jgi:hypothetical protein